MGELSRPIKVKHLSLERIYLSDGSDFDERMPLDDDEPAQEFDPLFSEIIASHVQGSASPE